MTVIYYYISDLSLRDRLTVDPPRPQKLEQWRYFGDAWKRGDVNEVVEELAPGCVLERHWKVRDTALAFPDMFVKVKRPGTDLPDVMSGQDNLIVSAKTRAAIESVDPDVHQFFPLRLFDESGASWPGEPRFALVIGRVIRMEEPKEHLPVPESDSAALDPRAELVDRIPGLATRLAALPLWTFKWSGAEAYFNETMMEALRSAELTGLDEYTVRGGEDGEVVQHIWFKELNA